MWIFQVRIWRKRIAIPKIKVLIENVVNQQLVSSSIAKYFRKVHRCQKLARNLIYCTRAKVTVLEILWDRIEYRFVRVSIEYEQC